MTDQEQTEWQQMKADVEELKSFRDLLSRLEVQMADGNNGAIVFTKDNAVIRIGTQT